MERKACNNIEYVGHKLMETYPLYTRISWNIIKSCNYNCWYCYDEDDKRGIDDYKYLTLEKAQNVIDNIKINYGDRDYLKLVITGGEPTLLGSKLIDIIEYINYSTNVKEIILHTNLSKNQQFFKDFASKISNFSIEINCSLHLDYISENNLDDYIHKVEQLLCLKVFVWVMVSDKNYERAIKYRQMINDYFGTEIANYKYIQHPSTWNFINSHLLDVNPEKRNIVYKTKNQRCYYNADELMLLKKNCYFGMICTRGYNQLSIEANGNLYASDCDWFERMPFLQAPGFLEKDVVIEPKKLIKLCDKKWCKHPSDNYIPKYAIHQYTIHTHF